jgi:hypothetical protein
MAEASAMPVCPTDGSQRPWNKGLLIGQKKPLAPKHVWSIRVRLEIVGSSRDLAIFNLAIDGKLRACDLVKLRLDDICSGIKVRHRAAIVQKKTGRGIPSKPGCQCSGLTVPDFSFQVGGFFVARQSRRDSYFAMILTIQHLGLANLSSVTE